MTSSNLETTDGTAPLDASVTTAVPEGVPAGDDTAPAVPEGATPGDDAAPAAPARKPRASRRIPKSDAVLEAAVERARLGVLEVAPEEQVGRHVSAVVEGERLVTHRFEAFLPGYGGWQWYASVARVARSKDVTVCEVGLLPSEASLIAPEWLPWSERVRPEDSQPDGPVPADGTAGPGAGDGPGTGADTQAGGDDGPDSGAAAVEGVSAASDDDRRAAASTRPGDGRELPDDDDVERPDAG